MVPHAQSSVPLLAHTTATCTEEFRVKAKEKLITGQSSKAKIPFPFLPGCFQLAGYPQGAGGRGRWGILIQDIRELQRSSPSVKGGSGQTLAPPHALSLPSFPSPACWVLWEPAWPAPGGCTSTESPPRLRRKKQGSQLPVFV